MSCMRASGIDGWSLSFPLRCKFTSSDASISIVISYTPGCDIPGPKIAAKNNVY